MTRIRALVVAVATFVAGIASGSVGRRAETQTRTSARDVDLVAVDKLHKADIEVTFKGDPASLASVFSDDAVNLAFPTPAVGGKAIREAFEKFHTEYPGFQVLKYKSDLKEIQFVDGWAIEVMYSEATYRMSAKDAPVDVPRTEGMRVLKRQPDGSWKFALVGLK
jgi:ketosteroid isomerase-like protein